jgi:hypothetical protein
MNSGICYAKRPGMGALCLAFFLALVSCENEAMGVSPDLLRSSPFAVLEWSPGEGYHANPSALPVSLYFSHVPDRASVERHFSLTDDGNPLSGVFHWDDKMVIFIPAVPLGQNRDYMLTLAADAHDEKGVSMDKAFEERFTTRPDNTRPVLVSVFPETNSVIGDPYTAVRLGFSQTVSLNTLRDNVSFEPSMNGSWNLEGDGTRAVFRPAEPWTHGTRYQLKISSSFEGNTGMALGKDFASVFTVGDDHEKPRLLEAWRITSAGTDKTLANGQSIWNSGWEKDDRLRLVFSERVDALSVRNCLSAEGAPSFRMETLPTLSDEIFFRFESVPAYDSRFFFRLRTGVIDGAGNESADEYVFRICADGLMSKPPELVGIRLPMAPGSAVDMELTAYETDSLFDDLPVINALNPLTGETDRYPYDVQTMTWIECYFETAPGLAVDIISLMMLFRVETSNNVLVFSPRNIKANSFSVADPQSGWEQYQRVEIAGYLTNTVNSGVVNIQIDSGLKDSGGNRSEKAFRISLLN